MVEISGGGFGDQRKRDRTAVKRDVKLGLVGPKQEKVVYGIDGDQSMAMA